MVYRVYISPSVVSVSKSGYDVLSPPAVSYDYLALDSRLDQLRPLMVASAVMHVGDSFGYGQTFAKAPFVDRVGYNPLIWRDNGGGGYHMRSDYNFVMYKDHFLIGTLQVYNQDPFLVSGFTLDFIVWERL